MIRLANCCCLVVCFFAACIIAGCAGSSSPSLDSVSGSRFADPDKLVLVDCMLPGQIRQLGTGSVYTTPRRAARIPAGECEIRLGEYVAYDRANYQTALNVWLPQARAGDEKAQFYVGEIYERGLGVAPDYGQAAQWYQQAASQGYSPALASLGYLYEKGLGVAKDPARALNLYRQASGLQEDLVYASQVQAAVESASRQIDALNSKLREETGKSEQLRQQLQRSREQLNDSESRLHDIRRELDNKQTEFQQLIARPQPSASEQEKINQLEREIEQREAALAQARSEVSTLQAQSLARKREFENQVRSAQSQQARLEAELAEQEEELRTRQREAQDLTRQLAHSQLELAQARKTMSRSRLELNQEQAQVSELKLQIAELLRQQQNVSRLKDDQNRQEKAELASRLESAEQQLASRQQRIKSLEAEISDYSVRITSLEQQSQQPPDRSSVFVRQVRSSVPLGNYHALIIGNSSYQSLPSLDSPVADAQALEKLLRQRYGYKTYLLLNATRAQIYQKIDALRTGLNQTDNLMIYFAGHGRLDDDNVQGFWLPVDATDSSRANWISNREIADELNQFRAKHVLVVSDACYSDIMTNPAPQVDVSNAGTDKARLQRLSSLARLRVRMVFSSGGENPVPDIESEHSVFARALLAELNENQGVLEGQVLASRVTTRMQAMLIDLKQPPGYDGVRNAGHLFGDYLFVPRV